MKAALLSKSFLKTKAVLFVASWMVMLTFGCHRSLCLLEGQWIDNSIPLTISDTISSNAYDSFSENMERMTVKTDSGLYWVHTSNDSVVFIEKSRERRILDFYFDDQKRGVASYFILDPTGNIDIKDLRWTGDNCNFTTFQKNNNTYLIFDRGFDQFGRSLDTVEYKLLSPKVLVIATDTLKKFNPK